MQQFAQQLKSILDSLLPESIPLPVVLITLAAGCIVLTIISLILFLKTKEYERKAGDARQDLEKARHQLVQQEMRSVKLVTMLKNERRHNNEKLQLLEDAIEQLRLQFTTLAQQIFEDKSSRFSELNREKLDDILTPFNRHLDALKQEIASIYRTDSRERVALKHEILQLRDLNQQINTEAANLTRALKSDTKVQGNWGELVLERVLERSGLRQGHEYEVQGTFRNDTNRLLRPDVIVHLPEERDIIIDSKVSLISWDKYISADDESLRGRYLSELTKSIRDHINSLSAKDYAGLQPLKSLDFVLMFMPVEAAFASVVEKDESILTYALEKNIIIVTPTTLLATLRTVENLWRIEQQSRSSMEIARRAGLMYDKLCAFVEDIDKVGRQLSACRTTYDQAINKLSRGRGNLISQAEQLRELGVQVKKELPASIVEISESDLKN